MGQTCTGLFRHCISVYVPTFFIFRLPFLSLGIMEATGVGSCKAHFFIVSLYIPYCLIHKGNWIFFKYNLTVLPFGGLYHILTNVLYFVFADVLINKTEASSNRLEQLLTRLNAAERRAKLLNTEVKSIRQEISLLRSTFSILPGPSSSTRSTIVSAARRRRLSSSSNDENTVDGPSDETKRSKSYFNEENGHVIVYTDGACENNGKAGAKAGIGVWFGDDHPLNISKPVVGRATNNTAEIQACVEALKVLDAQGIKRVNIFTDSQFTIDCMTKWIKNWKKNNWKTSSGGAVKNKEDLQKLDAILANFLLVKWTHVAGHKGIKGNEAADKLARDGAARYTHN